MNLCEHLCQRGPDKSNGQKTIRERTEKKVKKTHVYFIHMRIFFILIQIIKMRQRTGVYQMRILRTHDKNECAQCRAR